MNHKFDKFKIILTILIGIIPLLGGFSTYVLGLQISSIKTETKQSVFEEVEKKYATKKDVEYIKENLNEIKMTVKDIQKDVKENINKYRR